MPSSALRTKTGSVPAADSSKLNAFKTAFLMIAKKPTTKKVTRTNFINPSNNSELPSKDKRPKTSTTTQSVKFIKKSMIKKTETQ